MENLRVSFDKTLDKVKNGFRILLRLPFNFSFERLKNGGSRLELSISLNFFTELPSLSNFIQKVDEMALRICETIGRKSEQDQSIARTILLVLCVGLLFWAVNNIIYLFKFIF